MGERDKNRWCQRSWDREDGQKVMGKVLGSSPSFR